MSDGERMRAQLTAMKTRDIIAKVGVIACVLLCLILFSAPYLELGTHNRAQYTVYAIMGGQFEKSFPTVQICSIVVFLFTLLPAIFVLIRFHIRKRNLPITVSVISAVAVIIFCITILSGCPEANAVLYFIMLAMAGCVAFCVLHVKTLTAIDNLLYRPRTGGGFSK